MRWLILVFGIGVGWNGHAQEFEMDTLATRALHRFAANLTFAPAQIPFPMAYGINGYLIYDARWLLGIEYEYSETALHYLTGDIDSVRDTHFAVQALRFLGNSFHIKMALGQRHTHMYQAANLFDLTKVNRSETYSEVESMFVRVGVANLWHYNNRYSFGIDWMSVNFPFDGRVLKDASGYGKTSGEVLLIRDNQDILTGFPSVAFMKLQFGMVF